MPVVLDLVKPAISRVRPSAGATTGKRMRIASEAETAAVGKRRFRIDVRER
jgi:hypothetical protein